MKILQIKRLIKTDRITKSNYVRHVEHEYFIKYIKYEFFLLLILKRVKNEFNV